MFGIRQVLIQGGHNADLPLEYYEDAFKMMRSKYPLVGIHGLSASELDIISKVEKIIYKRNTLKTKRCWIAISSRSWR